MENTNISPTYGNQQTAQVMTVKDWIIASILVAIPIVGFIMLFIWAFGDGANPNKANWAKASLLFMVLGIALGFFIFVIVGGLAFLSNGY